MNRLHKRLDALELLGRQSADGQVIAFMVDGASDDDVRAIFHLGQTFARHDGEPLPDLVARAKAINPAARHHVMFFEYDDAVRVRMGRDYMPETLPNSWPVPSLAGHACHVEQRP